MENNKFIECERNRFNRLIKFRLPHKYLKLGALIVFLSLAIMFIRAFLFKGEYEWAKTISKQGFVLGMLIMSISKDKLEDERLITLRAQSYAIAFIMGVIYALVLPYVEFGVSNIVHSGGEAYKDLGDFQILTFMLMIQLLFYHNLKRFS